MCFWHCFVTIALIVPVFSPVSCRNSLLLELVATDEQQQGEAATSLSLTHSVKSHEQYQDSSPRLRRRVDRLQRQRRPQQSNGTDQSAGAVAAGAGFSWEAYLALNPDLSPQRYGSQNKAWRHYREIGQQEKRQYQLPQIILRYTAATGLSNQHYCHIAAFSLCAVLGRCSIVLPPAVARSSFQDAFSVFKEFNKVQWSAKPLETLYDTDKITAEWAKMGYKVWKTPALQELPALVQPESAFPRYLDQIDTRLITNVSDVYLRTYDMAELTELVTQAVLRAARQYKLLADTEARYIVVDLPVTLFMFRSSNQLDLVSKVARNLFFAPVVHQLADQVLQGMAAHAPYFNGAHLRVEADAMDWARSMGGVDAYWGEYLKAMETAGFDDKAPVYIATGLLSYEAGHATLNHFMANLTAEGLCNHVAFKEQILDSAELDALHSEQKALVDLLVLAKARSFVGFEPSTFSFFLSQYRVLQGLEPSSSVLVEGKIIGTNTLFEAAAVVVEHGFQQQKQVLEENGLSNIVTNRRLRL